MIFYDCPTAPSPRRARMFIAEKGLNIETHQVRMPIPENNAATLAWHSRIAERPSASV